MQQQLAPTVVLVSPTDLQVHALMAIELLTKHPETATELLTKFAGESPPAGFLDELTREIASFVATLMLAREQAEVASAQAESNALPKERLN